MKKNKTKRKSTKKHNRDVKCDHCGIMGHVFKKCLKASEADKERLEKARRGGKKN